MEYGNEIVRIEILTRSSIGELTHADAKLFFCLKGKIEIICGNERSLLPINGIKLVNERQKHSFNLGEDSLAAVFYINSSYISFITATPAIEFQLDSSRPPEYDYEQLRSLLRRILSVHTYQRWQEKVREQQYFCELVAVLLKNYAVWNFQEKNEETDSEDRTRKIVEFIHSHYNRQIGLGDLAERFHLSVPYLSKYIKKNLHTGFVEYLNSVRLSHTIDDLLLTEHSVTRIAFDNGFSNLASFNRVFKEAFSVTPYEYRKQNAKKKSGEIRPEHSEITLLKDYLSDNGESVGIGEFENRIQCRIDTSDKEEYVKIWNQLWNLGSAEEILRADVQKQILLMKQELEIKDVHIWGLFSEVMLISVEKKENYNFSRIDQVMDFLVSNQMTPFIDLGFHPKELYGAGGTILYREKESGYEDPAGYQAMISEFVRHCTERYGKEETERWKFEISKDDRLFLHGGKKFFELYESVRHTIKDMIPGARVGGGAIFIYDNLSILREFLSGWKKRKRLPDFLSIWIYPYELLADDKKEKKLFVTGNPDYICEKVSKARKIVDEYADIPLFVTRWDISLSCRNFLNESCYRAAALIKNTVSCLGKVGMMSCFGSTDLLCDFYDSSGSIFGGYGLITRDGIRKPAFYALQFLQNMEKFLVARGENYFITCDERNDLYLIIFNCCRMDTIFYQEQKEDIGPEKVDRLFEKERIDIQLILKNMEKGKYIIKKSSLGPEQGSLLDAWKKLGYKKNLDREEIRYLTSVCIPHLEYNDYEVRTGAMTVNTSLQANEIQLYQIRRERD